MTKDWDIIITNKSNLLSLELSEVWRYRDLLAMYVKRDIVTFYKQTVLGPLWFVIQPLFTTIMFMFVFGGIAGISYPLSVMKDTYPKYIWVLVANPLTAILETFKYAFTSVGEFNWFYLGYSFIFTIAILMVGIIIFNRVQRNFMDVI